MIWIPPRDGFVCGDVGVFPFLLGSWEVWRRREGEWQREPSLLPFKTIDEAKAAAGPFFRDES